MCQSVSLPPGVLADFSNIELNLPVDVLTISYLLVTGSMHLGANGPIAAHANLDCFFSGPCPMGAMCYESKCYSCSVC